MVAVGGRLVIQLSQVEQGGQQILVLIEAAETRAGGNLIRIAYDQRDVQDVVKDAVVVEKDVVVVKRLAVIAIKGDDGIVGDAHAFKRFKDRLNAGVHVGDGAVILGDDVIFVADARRHPGFEEVAEGLEGEHGVH